jgi:hypothetical protein
LTSEGKAMRDPTVQDEEGDGFARSDETMGATN